jgi:ribonuclease D
MLLIDNQSALDTYCKDIASVPWIAFDIEFYRRQTYWAIPCLIQLATEIGVVAVDLMAGLHTDALMQVLAKPQILKIVHAGGQDMEILWRLKPICLRPLADTQIMAAFAGVGDGLSLSALVQMVCQKTLPKDKQTSDWRMRPLSQAQLDYALSDVRYLGTVAEHLMAVLDDKNRLSWLTEEMERMYAPERLILSPERTAPDLKVGREGGSAARALSIWREALAQQVDKPRGHVLSDAVMVDIIKDRKRGWSKHWPKHLKEYQENIQELLEKSVDMTTETTDLNPAQENKWQLLQLARRIFSQEQQLPERLLATNRDLMGIVSGTSPLVGWRALVFAPYLEQVLAGIMAVKATNDKQGIGVVRLQDVS